MYGGAPPTLTVHHQDSVDSSDEYEDSVPPPCPPSPRSPPPSQSVSYPASIHNPTITVPETKKKQKKEKHKKRPFLFRRRKKESVGSLQAPSLRSADGLSSDSGSSFADVLMDPSLIRKRKGPGDRLLSLPVATITRSISDSAVCVYTVCSQCMCSCGRLFSSNHSTKFSQLCFYYL